MKFPVYGNMIKLRFVVPVFLGCLTSLVPCVLIAARQPAITSAETESAEVIVEVEPEFFPEPRAVHFFAGADYEKTDVIQKAFRRQETRDFAIDFFAEICPSREIAEIILTYADMYNIPPALALALAWEESRLNPRAVNTANRNGSIDRGLFQLNNRTFPFLDVQAFFNPRVSAKYGMSHLRFCLDTGGSEIAALAMYNAGTGRVNSSGTPRSTLDYTSRILENRRKIENRFLMRDIPFEEQPDSFSVIAAAAKPERPRLMPLKPLAGR